jgi:uncharacterized protein YuzE
MRMTYDPDADALMLRLSEAPVAESEEVAANVVLDFDAEGRVVGIEILFLSDLPDANPMELAYRILKDSAEKAA